MVPNCAALNLLLITTLALIGPQIAMAQTQTTNNNHYAEAWLAHAELPPTFDPGRSKAAWERKRKEIRERLWHLLGKLPAWPRLPKVQTLSREDRGDFVVEKFQFDNAAGAMVPGYVLLPRNISAKKAPAILYCHWHGGEYDLGKEELFQAKHTPEPPGPALARRG